MAFRRRTNVSRRRKRRPRTSRKRSRGFKSKVLSVINQDQQKPRSYSSRTLIEALTTLKNGTSIRAAASFAQLADFTSMFDRELDAKHTEITGLSKLGDYRNVNGPLDISTASVSGTVVVTDVTETGTEMSSITGSTIEDKNAILSDDLMYKVQNMRIQGLVKSVDLLPIDVYLTEYVSKETRPLPYNPDLSIRCSNARETIMMEMFNSKVVDDAGQDGGTYGDSAEQLYGSNATQLNTVYQIDSYDVDQRAGGSIVSKFWKRVKTKHYHLMPGDEIKWNSNIRHFTLNPANYIRTGSGGAAENCQIIKGITRVWIIQATGSIGSADAAPVVDVGYCPATLAFGQKLSAKWVPYMAKKRQEPLKVVKINKDNLFGETLTGPSTYAEQ